jgi:hypothetical protein
MGASPSSLRWHSTLSCGQDRKAVQQGVMHQPLKLLMLQWKWSLSGRAHAHIAREDHKHSCQWHSVTDTHELAVCEH